MKFDTAKFHFTNCKSCKSACAMQFSVRNISDIQSLCSEVLQSQALYSSISENILGAKGVIQYHMCSAVCRLLNLPCTLAHTGQQHKVCKTRVYLDIILQSCYQEKILSFVNCVFIVIINCVACSHPCHILQGEFSYCLYEYFLVQE